MERMRHWIRRCRRRAALFMAREVAPRRPAIKVGEISKFREGIAAKFAVIFSLLVLIATGTVGYMVYQGARQSLVDASADRLRHTAEVVSVRMDAKVEAIGKDLRFLAATPPVQGVIRAHVEGRRVEGRRSNQTYIDPKTYIDDQEWLDQLANIFTVFLKNRPSYIRASFVGVSDEGYELVRVEKQDNEVRRVPSTRYTSVKEQALVKKAVSLPPATLFLSGITLRSDVGGDSTSTIPTMRAIMPTYAANGAVYGFLTVVVDARSMLDTFRSLVDANISLYLANEAGQLLIAPGVKKTFQAQFPMAVPWFKDRTAASLLGKFEGENGTAQIGYFERMTFGGRADAPHYLMMGLTSPYDMNLGRVAQVRNRSLLITLLFGLVGIVLALMFSGYLTYPIRQVTRALSRLGRDGEVPAPSAPLPVHRKDEIGALARTFDAMARQIKHQMHELADKERRQRIILETSAEGIIVTSEDGVIETFNPAAEALFDYVADAMEGEAVDRLFATPGEAAPEWAASDWIPPWKQVGGGHEVTGRRRDGSTLALALAVSAFELAGEQKYALFLHDISARKRYERILQKAKEKAEEVAQLKSTFLANMSHEIRTPLTAVIGYAGVLAEEVDEGHRQFAHFIRRSGERLMDTLNSVLSLAQLEADGVEIQLDVMEVTREAEEIVRIFEPMAQDKNIALNFSPADVDEGVYARLDSGALSSILQNLIGNAIKFTEAGAVSVRVRADDEHIYLYVQDTGIGIDANFLPHLFDEFMQESTGVARTHEGSGLGLAITQRLVRLMDGRISVESEKGVGTVFEIVFPRLPAPEAAQDAPAPAKQLMTQQETAAKLLLAEDNTDTAALIAEILHASCEVTAATSAEEALCHAQEDRYDVILLDVNLGRGDSGVDVLHRLRAQPAYQDIPIAAVTAYALPGDRERFLQLGFDAYLSKPFAPEDLNALIGQLLETA